MLNPSHSGSICRQITAPHTGIWDSEPSSCAPLLPLCTQVPPQDLGHREGSPDVTMDGDNGWGQWIGTLPAPCDFSIPHRSHPETDMPRSRNYPGLATWIRSNSDCAQEPPPLPSLPPSHPSVGQPAQWDPWIQWDHRIPRSMPRQAEPCTEHSRTIPQ